ncbi:MAG: glycosyltransferase family 39 protein [Anaerolineae bacterium]|nr:glycosyltransferase family 39 protein [Anaerolineae bacterium]
MKQSTLRWLALVLLAFALRVYSLQSPPLAWDEGWSVALSQLPFSDLAYLTAADVHPPGYYLLLRGWLALGHSEFVIRYLSLLIGVLAVPLAYQAARAWLGRRDGWAEGVGLLAAGYVAVAPLLVYYSQVARMYALCVSGVLLAVWGLLRSLDVERPAQWSALFGWAVGALVALYSFYYSALALVGLALYALWQARSLWPTAAGRRGLTRLALATAAIAVVYVPWLVYAVGPVTERVADRTEGAVTVAHLGDLLGAGLYALVFAYGPGWPAVWAVALVVLAGAVVGLSKKEKGIGMRDGSSILNPYPLILLPFLAVALTLVGVALGTQAHMFAARYTIAASPFIALSLAYAVVALGARARRLGVAAGLLVLGLAVWPLWAGQVYAKGLERSGDFEPWADARALRAAGARADDVVVFNLLSLAGAYDVYRQPGDPPWTYAQRWDPVTEAWPRAEARLQQATASPWRVWSLLYKGSVGGNAQLKEWLDGHLYPVRAEWRGDTLTALYLRGGEPRADVSLDAAWPEGITLTEAHYPASASPTDGITIDLKWQAARELDRDYTVFVHLYDASGRLVAQHDSPPRGGSRPTSRWSSGKPVTDYHGLLLPPGSSGVLSLRVGLYDPATDQRLRLTDGRDMVEMGQIMVQP